MTVHYQRAIMTVVTAAAILLFAGCGNPMGSDGQELTLHLPDPDVTYTRIQP